MMRRVYCWRVGIALELDEGEICDECGSRDHPPVEEGTCGNFVAVAFEMNAHGVPCKLPPGHRPPCLSKDDLERRMGEVCDE